MCGAPVFPAIPTRFVYRPQAATVADVTDDVSSPPPSTSSTPSGWYSSLETSAPPRDTLAESVATYAAAALLSPQQQLMAEATRGHLVAAQQMAARPDRQAAATRGAPVVPRPPPPIKMMRFVPNTMMPAADVMDAGSSAPSTPSHCSSSLETTPSPRGPLPPSLSDSAAPCASQHLKPPGAAWGLATKSPMAPPLPFSMAPAPRVEVRQVWAHNFELEAKLIVSLLPKFRYVAVNTEFPGTVYRPAYTLKPEEIQQCYETSRTIPTSIN